MPLLGGAIINPLPIPSALQIPHNGPVCKYSDSDSDHSNSDQSDYEWNNEAWESYEVWWGQNR